MTDTSQPTFSLVEICAGAGGQSLGLHRAGFRHELAVELDPTAASTLAQRGWPVVVGDAADINVWNPRDFANVDLLAGGVPCPPFSVAGQQLGSSDERDLFAWAVELVGTINPRAVLLENVRGLSGARFAAYRQRVIDRLADFGYVGSWKVLHAADFGVPQLRPRFILVAMKPDDAQFFEWPEPHLERVTVGHALVDLMSGNGWTHAETWAEAANDVGPTLVGGSKRHGGADLGPTRAKAAWANLLVDGRGIANCAPDREFPSPFEQMPRLTIEMTARIQGWHAADNWIFQGGKTAQYRQIGNAFPPPVAEAVGKSIRSAFLHDGVPNLASSLNTGVHDPIYQKLALGAPVAIEELLQSMRASALVHIEQSLAAIRQDFDLEETTVNGRRFFKLGAFKGFVGQEDHGRHDFFSSRQHLIS